MLAGASGYRGSVIPAPRRTDGPLPGDLYLDSAVPECERLTMTRNGWAAQVTHVWTGTGWTRLVPGAVREVPAHQPLQTGVATRPAAAAFPYASASPSPSAPPAAPGRASTEEGLSRWRTRSAQRDAVKAAAAERRSARVADPKDRRTDRTA